jgi:hypothetical protein
MAAPTFVSSTSTVFNTTATPKTTASIAVQNGDVLVASVFGERSGGMTFTITTASGSVSAWTLQQENPIDNANNSYIRTATATATATGNITVNFTQTVGSSIRFGGTVAVFRNSSGIGSKGTNNNGNPGSAAPTVSITTSDANSALVFASNDWNAATGTVTFVVSSGTPVQDLADQTGAGSSYCVYSSHVVDAGAAGTKTMGMSSPSAQQYVATVIEVLGSGGGGVTLPETSTKRPVRFVPGRRPWLLNQIPPEDIDVPVTSVSGALDTTESTDTAAFAAAVEITGPFAATEVTDTAAFVAVAGVSLPITVTGLSTAVAVCGPFAFGPVEVSQIPVATISTNYQDFGQTAFISQVGFPFVAASSNSVTGIQVSLVAYGTLTDNVICQIFATSGGFPTGAALGTSTALVGSSIDTGFNEVYYNFPFPTPVALSFGVTYAAVFSRTGAADDTNKPGLFSATSPVGSRNLLYYDISGAPIWKNDSTSFPKFKITTNGQPEYFMFGRDGTTATTLQAYKWNGSSWASAATKTGFTTAILHIRGHHIDDTGTVHLAVMDGTLSSSVAVKYTSFDMGPETFLATTETVNAAASITGGLASGWGVDLVVRHDGTVVFIYNSVTVTSMARLSWRKRTGLNTYTAAVRVDDNTAFNNSKPAASISWADEVHFFWTFGGTNKFTQRTLDKTDVLQTATGTTTLATAWGGTVSYKEPFASFTSVTAGDFNAWCVDGSTPVINVTANAACGDTRRVFVDPGNSYKLHYIFINSSDSDVYQYSSVDDGVTFSPSAAGASIFAATATQAPANLSIDGKIYLRGTDYVVPYVVNDNGTLKYNEYVVRSITTSGTWASTEANDTIVISGSVAILGTLAVTEANDTALFAGGPVVSGPFASTEATDTCLINGFVGVSGTLATTEATDTANFAGGPVVSGPFAVTEAKDGAAFVGDVVVSGTLARTEAADTALFAGGPVISGPFASTETNDTALFAGGPVVSGPFASTEAIDTCLVSGFVGVSGPLVSTEITDTAAFVGTLAGVAITGTLAVTEGNDTASFAGDVIVSAQFASTEANDTCLMSGFVGVSGSLASTEITDTCLVNGFVGVSGSFASTEAKDAAVFAGSVIVSGPFASTETTDTCLVNGFVGVSGPFASTEATDTTLFAGTVTNNINASFNILEGTDTGVFAGSVIVSGPFASTEAKDAAVFAGDVIVSGPFARTEATDTCLVNGFVGVSGLFASTEVTDTINFAGSVTSGTAASFNILEGTDTGLFAGNVIVSGPFAVTEAKDSAAFVGDVKVSGPFAATEAKDTSVISGFVGVSGLLAGTETTDTANFSGTVVIPTITGIFAATESKDTANFSGLAVAASIGTLVVTESPDRAAFAGAVLGITLGTMSVVEAKDGASFKLTVVWNGAPPGFWTPVPDPIPSWGPVSDGSNPWTPVPEPVTEWSGA